MLLWLQWGWWLHLTLLRRGRLQLTLLSSLLSRRWGRWLHLTLLWRWWGRLNRRLRRRRLHLTLL